MDAIVANALERGKGRWGDDSYLARIIFCELVKDDVGGTAGTGIDVEPGDNEYPFLVVDLESQTVFRESDARNGFEYIYKPLKSATTSLAFEAFVAKHNRKPTAA